MENENVEDSEIKLFSRLSIVLFSTLFSTFFGSLIYAVNLKEIGKKNQILPSIIFGVLFMYLAYKLPFITGIKSMYLYIPIHLSGGLIFANVFWKHHIGDIKFEKRKPWGPILAFILPIILLILLNIFFR